MSESFFQFLPHIQAGLASGKYEEIISNGMRLGQVRDVVTGQFVEGGTAVGVAEGFAPASGMQLFNIGDINTLQTSIKGLSQTVGVLQASTAFIGVGVAATAALSAVNLWQTMKLRDDVKQLKLQVQDGFIDLKQALNDQGAEVLARIDQVAEDVEFRAHRTILSRAYQRFIKGTQRLQVALTMEDAARRDQEITSARDMMFDAVSDYENPEILASDYENPEILADVTAPGYLRRRECVWAIKQAIALTYQLQQEYGSANQTLSELHQQIEADALKAIELIKSEAELDFVFPELKRIWNQDRLVLQIQQAQNEEMRALSEGDRQYFLMSRASATAVPENQEQPVAVELVTEAITEPIELQQYREQQEISHPTALRDSLMLMVKPSQRLRYSQEVSDSAQEQELKALSMENLSQVSDVSLANLYHYLCCEDEDIAVEAT